MGTRHRDILGSALHRFAVWSDVDPATTYGTGESGVHAGLAWLEHAEGDPDTLVALHVRNEANDGWVEFGDWLATPLEMPINEEAAAYQLALSDAQGLVRITNAGAVALTVPDNATVAFPIGTSILIVQGGAGQVTITPAGGVTVNSAGAKLKLTAQHSTAALVKVAADEWIASGDLSA